MAIRISDYPEGTAFVGKSGDKLTFRKIEGGVEGSSPAWWSERRMTVVDDFGLERYDLTRAFSRFDIAGLWTEEMESAIKCTMRIRQICGSSSRDVVALRDDGVAFYLTIDAGAQVWKRLPPIPQD